MNSLILRTATRYVLPLLLMCSVFLLIRGHNEPGGGFTGGLMAAAAISLYAIAFDVPSARKMLRLQPLTIIGAGLLLASGSGLLSLLLGRPFMTGTWGEVDVHGLGHLALGTPVIFDIGVYLVVLGVTVLIILSLAEEWDAD